MFRSLAIRAGLFCLALTPFAVTASAQVKVAVINTQKAMADSDELKKASPPSKPNTSRGRTRLASSRRIFSRSNSN